LALEDYRALNELGIWTVRDGVRWHLIEQQPYHYDFSSVVPMLRAANMTGTQVIWDLFHYGWPDDLDIFSPEFVQRFRHFAEAFANVLKNETSGPPFICPVNEISFTSWAGGDVQYLNPFGRHRGFELKVQLVRATIAAIDAVREVLPQSRFAACEPVIHITADPARSADGLQAEKYSLAQYQAFDMLCGTLNRVLGGNESYLDVIGINYYSKNQWIHNGPTLHWKEPRYKAFREILREVYARYRRPLFIAETGIEGDSRPEWLAYIGDEVMAAIESGIPVQGVCLYPIVNHPGWDNDRHCHNGLLDYPDEVGKREIFEPLARELKLQQTRFAKGGNMEKLNGSVDRKSAARTPSFGNIDAQGGALPRRLETDLICLSHLRWGFVYQRPQHLLSRFADVTRVFFFEEPIFSGGDPRLEIRVDAPSGVFVVIPHLAPGMPEAEIERAQQTLLNQLIKMARIDDYFLWYYTPMAMGFTRELTPSVVIYDCMDELSAFQGAPPALREREKELFAMADMVFTGGQTLYEAKREQHPDVHAFPSSVDVSHFAQARRPKPDPADQAPIPHPRIGYCGVIDERMDLALLASVAQARPDWHLVMVGPIMKIDPASLPRMSNIHYLGSKTYKELPDYLRGWDVAMLPFARNESTKFISPTKTPEYLAAGKPAVSTSIRDVVRPYGQLGLVEIADQPEDFIAAVERSLAIERTGWLKQVDELLRQNSWDTTWERMLKLIQPRLTKSKVGSALQSGKQTKNSLKDVLWER
jgi:glycosyltransferase involved in cell wall biosynthesis